MLTDRSMGRAKYSTGLAELWEMVKNSFLRHAGIFASADRTRVIWDRK